MKNAVTFSISILLSVSSLVAAAQDKKLSVQKLLESKNFIFVPTSVTPQLGRTRFLDGYFDLRLKNDSMISYLPYFGRADMAPLTPDDTGMRFTSTNFSYSYKAGKKGRWDVIMQVNDNGNNTKFFFTVYDNFTAQLSASSNFRDQISFRGDIRPLRTE